MTTSSYPSGATGSAPGVAITNMGLFSTWCITPAAAELWWIATLGKARPSSSAVRWAPTTLARQRGDEHWWHRHCGSTRVHHRHRSVVSGEWSGPAHWEHRAVSRQRAHATLGVCPPQGTWINTGPVFNVCFIFRHTKLGIRARPEPLSRA